MKTDCYFQTDTPAQVGDLTASSFGHCRIVSLADGEAEIVNLFTGETGYSFISDLDKIHQ